MELSFDELRLNYDELEKREEQEFESLLVQTKASELAGKDTWIVAEKLYNVVRHSCFKRHFSTMSEFAAGTGLDSTTISTYCSAIEFDKKYNFARSIFSVNMVYVLSKLGDSFGQFLEYCESGNVEIQNLSIKRVNRLIASFENGEACPIDLGIKKMVKPKKNFRHCAVLKDDETFQRAFSWTISCREMALKRIDKSVYETNGTGIPEEIRWFWDIEDIKPDEDKPIKLIFKNVSYDALLYCNNTVGTLRTKMRWKNDLHDRLESLLSYDNWEKTPERFYLAFSLIDEKTYKMEVIEIK